MDLHMLPKNEVTNEQILVTWIAVFVICASFVVARFFMPF